ncbi:MAG TPA: hypothetical protein DCS30_13685 [Rhizobiales bacterium]|nr:hypothetical protein [Hyphomicrobiales bacterium]
MVINENRARLHTQTITRTTEDFKLANRIATYTLFIFPTIFLASVLLQPFAEPKWMFLDTLAAAEYAPDCCHVYYGLVSNMGLLLWTGTAAVCLLMGLVVLSVDKQDPFTRFALSAGSLTAWIAIDDMFLVHEKVFPAVGVPQTLVIISYMVLAGLYVLTSWKYIFRQQWWMLALGAIALASSIFIDLVFHSLDAYLVYLEDSAKFFGIVCWSIFHFLTTFNHFHNQFTLQVNIAKTEPLDTDQ